MRFRICPKAETAINDLGDCLGADGLLPETTVSEPFRSASRPGRLHELGCGPCHQRYLEALSRKLGCPAYRPAQSAGGTGLESIGPKEYARAPSISVVNAKAPFDFSLRLSEPPAREILDNPDVAIGQFWLYNDTDSNGTLDRLVHPGMVPLNSKIDSLYRAFQHSESVLVAAAEIAARFCGRILSMSASSGRSPTSTRIGRT